MSTKSKAAKPAPPAAPAGGVKKVAQQKKASKKPTLSFVEKRPKNFGLGIRSAPKRDLTRFVRWPRYVRVQRQRKILLNRMKVPPVINQFTKTLDKGAATLLFKLLHSHRPETPEQKKKRLLEAAVKKEGQTAETKKPNVVKAGIRHVTALVEQKQAKLVVIANDVDPLELVLWLPTLCKKKGIPYVIVSGKARLGQVVGKKTATALAFVNVDAKDKADFANLVQIAQERYNNVYAQTMKTYGGLGQGIKHLQAKAKRLAIERAAAKKA